QHDRFGFRFGYGAFLRRLGFCRFAGRSGGESACAESQRQPECSGGIFGGHENLGARAVLRRPMPHAAELSRIWRQPAVNPRKFFSAAATETPAVRAPPKATPGAAAAPARS